MDLKEAHGELLAELEDQKYTLIPHDEYVISYPDVLKAVDNFIKNLEKKKDVEKRKE